MGDFKDPTRLTSAAILALCGYMALKWLLAIEILAAPVPKFFLPFTAGGYILALLACYVVVGMWIYRTNANAHSFGVAMSISPGWSVGWFFIPFANLVMPYRGVQETWRVSHEFAGRFEAVESSLLGWWWGLWIANYGVPALFSRMFRGADFGGIDSAAIGILIAAAASLPLCLVFILLMRRLVSAQLAAAHGSIFA